MSARWCVARGTERAPAPPPFAAPSPATLCINTSSASFTSTNKESPMQLSIKGKLFFVFAVIYAVCVLGVGGYVYTANSSAGRVQANYSTDLEASTHLAKAQDSVWALRWGFAQFIAVGDANPEARAKVLEAEPKHLKTVTESLAAYGKLDLGSEERTALTELEGAFKQYYEARAPWFKLMNEGKNEEAAELRARTTTPFGAATVKALVKQFEVQQAAGALSVAEAAATGQKLQAGLALLFGLLLLPLPLVWWLSRSITQPLDGVISVMQSVAQGDLSREVPEGRDVDTGRMLAALDAMQIRLRALVGEVRTAAVSIEGASSEVAAGSTDLSSRTEQAASSLQETASAMEQLTSTVATTADSARTANQLATSASQVAERGGTVVSQVVATMDEINDSSRKIADIIGVIDSIAFQTNILALNAAVEAARAGEQGRGFAVVAGEVRNLAQRSAEAAREIKGLIGASVERVQSGSRLVQDAGATMTEIVASVKRVSDIIGEISAAASEQNAGIGQVNGAVAQLDGMTQQNAALVEESAAAASSLTSQAAQLVALVGTFRTGDEGTTSGRVAPTPPARVAAKAIERARKPGPVTARAKPSFARPTAGAQSKNPPVLTTAVEPARTTAPSAAAATTAAADAGDWTTF